MSRSASRPPGPSRGAVALAVVLALVLLAALLSMLPDRRTPLPGIRPSMQGGGGADLGAATAGPGSITPAMRAEIDRVVAEGTQVVPKGARGRPSARAAAGLARCADFAGQRYCLHTGWTTRSAAAVAAAARRAVVAGLRPSAGGVRRERTGDLGLAEALARSARMTPRERAAAERAELEQAARSVAKVWLLRHQLEGLPLPEGFLADHPEVRVPSATTRQARAARGPFAGEPKAIADYPERSVVLRPERTMEQVRSYWCGPAALQMIWWGWHARPGRQRYFARRLGTTTEGSSISDMVREVNGSTGWDLPRRAGSYVVLDIGGWRFRRWLRLQMRHVADFRAPVVLHPVLEKRFFPYLDDDASGHFQVGRGYDKNGDGPALLSFFEPWNQQRFDPSEPFIPRLQWRNAYRSYRANQAHPEHNIGV